MRIRGGPFYRPTSFGVDDHLSAVTDYAKRISAFVLSLVGMVKLKLPADTVCDPKVNAATALFDWVLLYNNTQSNAVAKVTVVHEKAADGVQKAVVPEDDGAVALVTATPPAV